MKNFNRPTKAGAFRPAHENERKKIKAGGVIEPESDSDARIERLGVDAFKEFVGIVSIVDSRTGQTRNVAVRFGVLRPRSASALVLL